MEIRCSRCNADNWKPVADVKGPPQKFQCLDCGMTVSVIIARDCNGSTKQSENDESISRR